MRENQFFKGFSKDFWNFNHGKLILYTANYVVDGGRGGNSTWLSISVKCPNLKKMQRSVNMVLFIGIFHTGLRNHRKSDTSNLNTTSILHKGHC